MGESNSSFPADGGGGSTASGGGRGKLRAAGSLVALKTRLYLCWMCTTQLLWLLLPSVSEASHCNSSFNCFICPVLIFYVILFNNNHWNNIIVSLSWSFGAEIHLSSLTLSPKLTDTSHSLAELCWSTCCCFSACPLWPKHWPFKVCNNGWLLKVLSP